LAPGACEVRIKKRRAVTNHIGTVHAIALCNAAELAAGMMTNVSIPEGARWIPKGMTVEYLKKAETDLRAVASLPAGSDATKAGELPVLVDVKNTADETVFRARITMWVSQKK
jgi:acyl-coenzyme A thioesterase PaaI-like protein